MRIILKDQDHFEYLKWIPDWDPNATWEMLSFFWKADMVSQKREVTLTCRSVVVWVFKSPPYLDWSSINQIIQKQSDFSFPIKTKHCQGFVNIFSFNKLIWEFTRLSSQNLTHYIRPDDSFRPQTGKQNKYLVFIDLILTALLYFKGTNRGNTLLHNT